MYNLNEPVRVKTAKGWVSGRIWTISHTSPPRYDILPEQGVEHVIPNVPEQNLERELESVS